VPRGAARTSIVRHGLFGLGAPEIAVIVAVGACAQSKRVLALAHNASACFKSRWAGEFEIPTCPG